MTFQAHNTLEQGRRNGLEYGGDNKNSVTFEPFVLPTSNLQFKKWQVKSQNMVGTSPYVPIYSGGPVYWLETQLRAAR